MHTWAQVWNFFESKNINISSIVKEYSDDDISLVFNMGLKCFEYIRNTSLDEKVSCELKAKDDALRTAIECVLNEKKNLIHEIETKNKELNVTIETMHKNNLQQDLQRKLEIKKEVEDEVRNECMQQHQVVVLSLKEQISILKDTFVSLKEDKDLLQKRHDDLHQKLPHMNMVALGNIGENVVEQLTRESYNYECDITSSSSEKHCMDIRVSTPSGFNANIEVKTADPIQSTRDVQKYHRDLNELIERSEINASAFISLKAPIPNFKSGTLIFKTNAVGLKIPVIYIQVTSKELLRHCLVLLRDIQQICQLEHDARGSQPMPMELEKYQEEKKIFKTILPDIFKNNADEEEELTSQLDHIKRIKEISETRLGRLQLIRQIRTRLLDEIPWLFDDSSQRTNKLDKAILIWEKFKEDHKKEPERLSCFGADEPFIKNIGYARLKEAVRENRKKRKMM